jgi:hypothetical protein
MIKITKTIFVFVILLFLFYISLPSPDFPGKLPDSIQSGEPADVETPLRRGYYTDYTRSDVIKYYFQEFSKSKFLGIPLPTYILNYPPEESQTLIRDQARSTYLEEIVHPFRESIFINGYEPKEANNMIQIDGKFWQQKVIVRYYSSNVILRLTLGVVSVVLIYILSKEWLITFRNIRK